MTAQGAARRLGRTGLTLIEVVAASLIASVVAGGTLMAFVTAARMATQQGGMMGVTEATFFAEESVEAFRNHMACDDAWFDPATCTASASMPTAWTDDPLPAGAGSESILSGGAKRCYRMTPTDCDPATAGNECYQMEVKVCWGDMTGCPCP